MVMPINGVTTSCSQIHVPTCTYIGVRGKVPLTHTEKILCTEFKKIEKNRLVLVLLYILYVGYCYW
jgi:hypothetical protein